MNKELKEFLQHEEHEHKALHELQRQEVAKGMRLREFFFKKNEKAMRARGDNFRKSRRQFLEFMGKTGVSASMLRAFPAIAGVLAARTAHANDEAKRAVFCYINSGAPDGYWLPKSANEMNLVTEPYAAVASICNFREIDAVVPGHGRATTALGARSYGQPTSDTIAAPVLSASTPFSNVFLGSAPDGQDISAFGKPKSDPQVALNDYFSAGGGDNDGPDTTYLKAYQAQVRAVEQLKNKLSMDERDRLNEHAAALEKIEKRITDILNGATVDPASCKPVIADASHYMNGDIVKMLEHGKVQVDIIIAALSCGLTNLATLQLGAESGTWKTHGVDHYRGFTGDSHGSVHAGYTNDAGVPISYVECHRYLSQVPVYFIEQLMSVSGPDGKPLIETTVFAQTTCMGNGMSHATPNAPFILATKRPEFKNSFSAANMSASGTTYDFNETILKGLGVPGDFASNNTLDLLS
ncbi:DUF1552 domain-containing protein [Agaribacterium haliotis]|uniref:DUF1552 domain-containing protein n=1 Tax=Agaribacterium haliotis TaxID=2013869 RepID=UPI000BB55D8D|nr:DUF1552 domain-containing protein [Agaribacterium haliotis]